MLMTSSTAFYYKASQWTLSAENISADSNTGTLTTY